MVLVSSCNKYEEGPILSFRAAKSRIEGKWKVTSFTETTWNKSMYGIMIITILYFVKPQAKK